MARHIELAREVAADGVEFILGSAEAIPAPDAWADLVWCRDVLVHVADLNAAYWEFRRVLRPGGKVLVYQMFATERLEPAEADWLFATMGVVPLSADAATTEAAIAAAGLVVDKRIDLTTEWGEFADEQSGKGSRQLLHAARLLRDPGRYRDQFGDAAYDIMLGDCLWHVYRMIGKLSPRLYLLSSA